jgi:hypothetical protein
LKPNHHHPFQFCSVTTVKNQTVIARVRLETKHVYKTHLLRKVNHFNNAMCDDQFCFCWQLLGTKKAVPAKQQRQGGGNSLLMDVMK